MGQVRYKTVEKNGVQNVEEYHKVIVHQFKMSDVEDPDLYAAEPLHQWQESDPGKFVMEHAVEKPEWHRNTNFDIFGYRYVVIAELEKKKLSEFYMRWGKPNGNS
jgi:hypothetical protein